MQTAIKQGIAYDLSRFDNRHIVRQQLEKERSKSKARTKPKERYRTKPCFSGFTIFSWIVCMGLLVMMLFSYVALTEVSDKSIKLKNKLADMKEQTQMLEIQKGQKFGSNQIQMVAVEQLGMQKIDKSQVTYVNTQQTDKVEVINQDGLAAGNSKILAGIANGFRTFLEYLN